MLIRVFDSRLYRPSLCLIREQGPGFDLLVLQSSYMGRLGPPLNCVGLVSFFDLCTVVRYRAVRCGVVRLGVLLCSRMRCCAVPCYVV